MKFHFNFLSVLACVAAVSSVSAHASCDGCTVKNGMILFPASSTSAAGPRAEVYLGWNFAGVPNVDYSRILTDADYGQQVFGTADNMDKITNYLTTASGRILVQVPDVDPAHPYGGIFGGAGLSPNHRGSQFGEDVPQGYVYFGMDTRWDTASLDLYVKRGIGPTLTLTKVEGVGAPQITAAYRAYLNRAFGNQANYKRDGGNLAITLSLNPSNRLCKPKDVNLCFEVDATSEVPKGMAEDSFTDGARMELGVKLGAHHRGELRVFSVVTAPQP